MISFEQNKETSSETTPLSNNKKKMTSFGHDGKSSSETTPLNKNKTMTPFKQSEEKRSSETSPLNAVLTALLNDESLSDVTLEGTDRKRVFANRSILAARSHAFKQMLFGQSQEANSSVVKVGYSGDVLRAIVQYCYTSNAEMLVYKCTDPASATRLVDLMKAAAYFSLPDLQQAAEKVAIASISNCPSLAFIFLQESKIAEPAVVGPKLKKVAMQWIRKHAWAIIADDRLDALCYLCPPVLESILKDDKMEATEYTLFLMLKAWAESENAKWTAMTIAQRKTLARQILTTHINLENIAPSVLANIVEPSNLASPDQLQKAFRQQALRSDEPWCTSQLNFTSQYNKPRYVEKKSYAGIIIFVGLVIAVLARYLGLTKALLVITSTTLFGYLWDFTVDRGLGIPAGIAISVALVIGAIARRFELDESIITWAKPLITQHFGSESITKWAVVLITGINAAFFCYNSLKNSTANSGVRTGKTAIGPDGAIIRQVNSDESRTSSVEAPSHNAGTYTSPYSLHGRDNTRVVSPRIATSWQ